MKASPCGVATVAFPDSQWGRLETMCLLNCLRRACRPCVVHSAIHTFNGAFAHALHELLGARTRGACTIRFSDVRARKLFAVCLHARAVPIWLN